MSSTPLAAAPTADVFLPLLAGSVQRYHVHAAGLFPQSVAEHSWRVAALLLRLWPDAPRRLIVAALAHDLGEWFSGDVPYPAKAAVGGLKATLDALEDDAGARAQGPARWATEPLSPVETVYLQLLDMLELAVFLLQRRAAGVMAADPILHRACDVMAGRLVRLEALDADPTTGIPPAVAGATLDCVQGLMADVETVIAANRYPASLWLPEAL